MAKKLISLLLVLLMIVPVFAACSDTPASDDSGAKNNSSAGDDVTTEEETTKRFLDDMQETMDFGGETIRFIVEEGSNGKLSERSILSAEEASSDVVDAAVYDRNLAVSERLNINIELLETIMFSGLPAKVRPSILAGADDYDIIGTYQYYGISMAPEGLMLNLNKLEYNDFDREYWAVQYMNNMSYKGSRYWATGDMSLRYIGGMYVSYVNSRLWNNYYADTSVYDLVNNGQWTLDKLSELAQALYIDENGNGKPERGDQFGFIINVQDPIEGLMAGANVKISEFDADGVPQIIVNNERTLSFYDRAYNLLYKNEGAFLSANDDSVSSMQMFAEGNIFSTVNKLYQSEVYLREMEDDFYILPVPKLDETQEHYNTMLHDGVTMFGVPVTNSKLQATSATLEALASESFRLVAPAYYETALKVKYARDTESAQMIDLIRQNVSADFAALYSHSIADIVHFFRNQLGGKKDAIASQFTKLEKPWNKALSKLLDNLENNADK
jgi:hypothetical protein